MLGALCLFGEVDVNLNLRTLCQSEWLVQLQLLIPVLTLHSDHRPFLAPDEAIVVRRQKQVKPQLEARPCQQ
jgi:hypothetical protein